MTRPSSAQPVQLQALLGQPHRERRRVWAFAIATLYGVVGDEPGVAAAPHAARGARPSSDVRLVLVLHADREPVEPGDPTGREVEHELVAVVQEPVAVDGLVVPDRQIVGEAGPRASEVAIDRDRLDPVDDVLQLEVRAGRLRDVEGGPWVRGLAADVQEQRSLVRQRLRRRGHPLPGPLAGSRPAAVRRRSCGNGCPGCRAGRSRWPTRSQPAPPSGVRRRRPGRSATRAGQGEERRMGLGGGAWRPRIVVRTTTEAGGRPHTCVVRR